MFDFSEKAAIKAIDKTYSNPLKKVNALYVYLQSKFHLYVHLL